MTKYIKYRLLSLEPVRIADDSSAKQGQAMTQRYIPGSTMRGLVVSALSGRVEFSQIRKKLLSEKVRFMNAYLTVCADGQIRELLPAPKGFYEDKSIPKEGQRKKLKSIVTDGAVDDAMKRAGLGVNVYFAFENDAASGRKDDSSGCIHYYSPRIIADTKIHLGRGKEQDIFRSTSMDAGYRFTGYIAVDDADLPLEVQSPGTPATLAEAVKSVLHGTVVIGNARTSGLGKCFVEYCALTETMPYADYSMGPDLSGSEKKDCYMLLLSDTVMRDRNGEYCGLDPSGLEEVLGVRKLRIVGCSTSVTEVRGFNRHYGGPIPSVVMYEKGSLFHLQYEGCLDRKHLEEVHRKGIGVRRNEGFGQILFLDHCEDLRYKQKGLQEDWNCSRGEEHQPGSGLLQSAESAAPQQEKNQENHAGDREVLRIAAKARYRNMIRYAMQEYIVHEKPGMNSSASQLGNILSIATADRFRPEDAWKSIDAYYMHKIRKEGKLRVHGEQAKRYVRSNSLYEKVILPIRDLPLYELLKIPFRSASHTVMGFEAESLLDREEEQRLRLELLIQLIRFDFKREVRA